MSEARAPTGTWNWYFRDFPRVPINASLQPNGMTFELFLVEWDGARTVHFLDGIAWGYRGVPEPTTLLLLVVAALAWVRSRPR